MKRLKFCWYPIFAISFAALITTLLLTGCTLIKINQKNQPVIDEFALEYKQWQKEINEGDKALQEGKLDRALKAYQQAVAIKPESSKVHIKIGQIYLAQKEYNKAIEAFRTGLQYEPSNNDARNYLGYLYEQLGKTEKAAHEYEIVLKSAPQNLYALNHLGLMYYKLGRLDEAEALLRKALKIDPNSEQTDNKNVHNYLGLIYEKRGEIERAIAEYRKSIRLNLDNLWALKHLGSLYEDNGRYYEARLIYLELLKIDPNNSFAASRLKALEQLSYPQTITEVKPVEIIKDDVDAIIKNAPSSDQYPEDDAVILLDEFSHEVLEDGSSRYTTHQIIKILTDRGVKKYGDVAIAFHSQSQNIDVNIARTILPDGTIVEPSDEAYNEITSPGLVEYNLFSDIMWEVIAMPALKPGVIIEYEVTIEDAKVEDNMAPNNWFWGDVSFQSTDPTLRSKCALRIPIEMEFKWKTYNCNIKPNISIDNKKITYIWDYGGSKALKVEPNMPPLEEVIPRLSYSSVDSWEEVQKWYYDLAKNQYEVDEAIKNKVKELSNDAKDEESKIRAIYNFVTTKVRYVGIEFGQGAYQPSSAIQVFERRYGDCKDKVTLLIAMLKVAQITAYPAMIDPVPYSKVDIELPSPSQFAHLICVVPKAGKPESQKEEQRSNRQSSTPQTSPRTYPGPSYKEGSPYKEGETGDYLWLDPTVETCSYNTLPYQDQGRQAFVITKSRSFFTTTPISQAEDNKLVMSIDIKINRDGTMTGVEQSTTSGQFSVDYRFLYKSIKPSDLVDFFEMSLNQKYPGVKVHDVSLSGVNDLDIPIKTVVKFSVDHYGIDSGDEIIIPIPDDNFSDQAGVVAQKERKYDLKIGYPMQIQKEVTVNVPDGYTLLSFYQPIEMKYDFGKFSRQYTCEGKTVKYSLNYTVNTSSIPPSKYQIFKRFIEAISREDKIQLIFGGCGLPVGR